MVRGGVGTIGFFLLQYCDLLCVSLGFSDCSVPFRVASFDMDFLSGSGCFWFRTLTEEDTSKTRRVQFCKLFFSFELVVVVFVVIFLVSEISDTLCFQCV